MTIATQESGTRHDAPTETAVAPLPRQATRISPWPWLRLVGVLVLAVVMQMVYVAFWPVSYYLTQGPDFTYELLVQYGPIWERLLPLLVRFEATWPEGPRSLEFMVDALIRLFLLSFGLYLAAFLLTRAGLPRFWGVAVVIAPALAFQATLFLLPGLFTTDLFSYVVYGQIAGPYGLNPYMYLPAYFPQNRVFHWIHPIWHYAPSVYGPAWLDISEIVGRLLAGQTDVDKVMGYKLLVNVAHLASVGLLALAVRRVRSDAVLPAVMLYAWNPLILFEFAGNGHNDAVMVAGMLLAVALFAARLQLVGLIALTVSMLIKMSSVLLMPYYVVGWARARGTLSGFAAVVLLAGATMIGVVVTLYARWWVGIETVGPILTWSQGPMYLNFVPDLVAQRIAFEYLLGPAQPDPAAALEEARGWVKVVTRTVFAGYCAWELLSVRDSRGLAAAGARVMVAFLLLFNTWVLPWYYTWPLALAAVAGWQTRTAKVVVGFSLSAPTVMYYNHFWNPYMSPTTYLLYLAPLAIVPLGYVPAVLGRLRRGWRGDVDRSEVLRSYGVAR